MNIRINWKVRLRNGNWLASMAALIIAFVYYGKHKNDIHTV